MKTVYLTVDDGPSDHRKQRVDILKSRGIQAIWFCVGKAMEEKEEAVLYTIEQGGIIANHSYNHPRFSEISLEECYDQIYKTDLIIEAIYNKACKKRPAKWFRFPYGDKGVKKDFFSPIYSQEELERINKIQDFLKALDYTILDFKQITYDYYQKLKQLNHLDWYWTYDVMEWCTFQEDAPFKIRALEDVLELMDLDFPQRGAGLNTLSSEDIIVIHDHPQTTFMFESIIDKLISKQLIFEKII
ncbi:MAG: polysaccharide deacetylase [Clostridia bacterium]|jgi:peptidoglycan/xylan/chitin deacetylase (PgdA/CDA1 family)|nr:polysaccharide deacetylase [Clostridia bacterium]